MEVHDSKKSGKWDFEKSHRSRGSYSLVRGIVLGIATDRNMITFLPMVSPLKRGSVMMLCGHYQITICGMKIPVLVDEI